MALRSISLCAGIGGIDIGLRQFARTVCYVERDRFAVGCLVSAMRRGIIDDAPVWDDVRTFDAASWRGKAELVCAGFPCQAHSTASRGRRVAPDLWPDVLARIDELAAPFVFLENVQRRPIERAASELRERRYRAEIVSNDAADMGAAHRRVRWWLLAYAHDARESALAFDEEMARVREAEQTVRWLAGPGGVLGVDVRLPNRSHRLRAVGNAVVPAQAARAFAELARRAVSSSRAE